MTDVVYGIVGPIIGAGGSFWFVARAHRRDPQSVTKAMIQAFAFKFAFFGAYVVVMLKGFSVNRSPFIISFVLSLVGLYLTEALFLQRLFK